METTPGSLPLSLEMAGGHGGHSAVAMPQSFPVSLGVESGCIMVTMPWSLQVPLGLGGWLVSMLGSLLVSVLGSLLVSLGVWEWLVATVTMVAAVQWLCWSPS